MRRHGGEQVVLRREGENPRPPGSSDVLRVLDLRTEYETKRGVITAVAGVTFTLAKDETIGLVGESGSGKTATALSIMRLVRQPGRIAAGRVELNGVDLLRLSETEMRRIRGRRIAMIFQNPMSALNPRMKIGTQIEEVLRLDKVPRSARKRRVVDLLQDVGVDRATQRVDEYPHELSGGLRQRVMIAIALARDPDVLLADEPTTALDVTIEAQVLELLAELRRARGLSIVLVSHNLAVVEDVCDRVLVMYAGELVEAGRTREVLGDPKHPYTARLLECVPRINQPDRLLIPLAGLPPDPADMPIGCPFAPRCPHTFARCEAEHPRLFGLGPGRAARCFLHDNPGNRDG